MLLQVDDALCVEERADGSVVLWVAIADPTRLVPADSRLFKEALARQASLYLPTGRSHPWSKYSPMPARRASNLAMP